MLYIDGKKVGKGRLERTVPMVFRRTRHATSARKAVRRCHRTTGPRATSSAASVNWVQIDLEKDDHDHLISPEERFRVAMVRQ